MKLRTEILEISLKTEESINSLLLVYLRIDDKSRTKLFGKKAGISFKSKIDLLYDINVLSKEEHQNIELLMNFRNKFLHDISCDTFINTLTHFDNGIKNRFSKFLSEGETLDQEESCRTAFGKLYINNAKIIGEKFKQKRLQVENNSDTIQSLLITNERVFEISFKLLDSIMKELEESELENPKIRVLSDKISEICQEYGKKFSSDEELQKLKDKLQATFENKDRLTNLLG
ncbi:hypothetical protein [Aquimarina sediminis]|uniref:hypothetical protein n=1 Tax=Aquimarina sediminis TaxID=2070536 RepID=UPI000CA00A92|nr:hypothetical protein [Aquimarina sediminis]